MSRKRAVEALLFGFTFYCLSANLFGQSRAYLKTQISAGAFNHESPSINNAGDVVWSQQVGGFWQVYILRAGSTTPVPVPGQAPDHNNTNNLDGVVDIRDLSYVSQKLPAGTRCQ